MERRAEVGVCNHSFRLCITCVVKGTLARAADEAQKVFGEAAHLCIMGCGGGGSWLVASLSDVDLVLGSRMHVRTHVPTRADEYLYSVAAHRIRHYRLRLICRLWSGGAGGPLYASRSFIHAGPRLLWVEQERRDGRCR